MKRFRKKMLHLIPFFVFQTFISIVGLFVLFLILEKHIFNMPVSPSVPLNSQSVNVHPVKEQQGIALNAPPPRPQNNIEDRQGLLFEDNKVIKVGENVLDNNSNVILGQNWTGSFSEGFTHSSGEGSDLIIQTSITDSSPYLIEWDETTPKEGLLFVAFGESQKADGYNGTNTIQVGIFSDGGNLVFSAHKEYTGTISNITIKAIHAGEKEVKLIRSTNAYTGESESRLTGFWNIGIGNKSLISNQNGSRNIAIGNFTLQQLVSGTRNIAIGTYANGALVCGERNIAIGADSHWQATNSSDCIAIGKGAMPKGNNSKSNIAIGTTAMGKASLESSSNVCIGQNAGYVTNKYGCFVGHMAGFYTSGANNTCIGYNANIGNNQNSLSNSIAIGANTVAKESNQVVIGNDKVQSIVIAGKLLIFNADGTVTWSIYPVYSKSGEQGLAASNS